MPDAIEKGNEVEVAFVTMDGAPKWMPGVVKSANDYQIEVTMKAGPFVSVAFRPGIIEIRRRANV